MLLAVVPPIEIRVVAGPKDQAEAVLLRVVAGLDVAQTAKVLDKRDGAVRIAAMRGLKRLAAILAEQQEQAEGENTGDSGASGGMEGTGDTGTGRSGRGSRTVKGAEYG